MSKVPQSERSLIGRLGADTSWAKTEDRAARTKPARDAALERFEREVDPEGVLTTQERAIRAAHARRAYFTRLALKSAQSRRKAKESTAAAIAAETELDEFNAGGVSA